MKTLLLNPGPVSITKAVRKALSKPDLCHREPECAQLVLNIVDKIARVYPDSSTEYKPVLLTGSGTLAVEAMLSSFLKLDSKALVVTNGVYGERMVDILNRHQKQFIHLRFDWCDSIDIDEVRKLLEKDASISHIVSVHHETTTGRLNDIKSLSMLCQSYGVDLLLDAVSSFGGEFIDFSLLNIAAYAATANKCLHGVPGICFVLARNDIISNADRFHPASLYCDIFEYERHQRSGYFPFTPAIQSLYALDEALNELLLTGGWKKRNDQYRILSNNLRSSLTLSGFKMLLKEEEYASMLTSFLVPKFYSYDDVYSSAKKNGFTIYSGQGNFNNKIFRIATMGNISEEDIQRLVRCLKVDFDEIIY